MTAETQGREVLLSAAEILSAPGAWMQGDYCDDIAIETGTCFCIAGAVAKVLDQDGPDGEKWLVEFVDPLGLTANERGEPIAIVNWNDDVCRSQEQAVAKLHEIATALAKAETGR